MTTDKLKPSMKLLGFDDVVEVAIGADLCTIEEAKDFMREVPEHQPFMATSCCPAWSVMAKKLFPDFAPYISMAMTPMVLTARLIEKGTQELQSCLYRTLRGEEAGGQPPHDPQRRRFCFDL